MKLSEVMTRDVEAVSPAATLEQAGKKMKLRNIGFLPVVEDGKLLGVLTDRDIVTRAVSEGMRPAMTRVREVMTPRTITCQDDQTLTDVSLLMEENLVRRVIVINKSGNLVGIVSLDDIATKTTDELLSGHVLSKVVPA